MTIVESYAWCPRNYGPILILIKDVEGKVQAAKAAGQDAHYLITDGQDTAHLLRLR